MKTWSVYQTKVRETERKFYTGMTSQRTSIRVSKLVSRARRTDDNEPIYNFIREEGFDVDHVVVASGLTKEQAGKIEEYLIATETCEALGGCNRYFS